MNEKITFKEIAKIVLEKEGKPLTPLEIWNIAEETSLSKRLESAGKTPWRSIGAQLYVDIRDNPKSKFYQYSSRPGRFFLKELEKNAPKEETILEEEESEFYSNYNERELHQLLTNFVNSSLDFRAQVKTIYHERSSRNKKGLNEWIHPDLVGVHLPFSDFDQNTLQIQKELYWTAVRFFSFEMKKVLTVGNLREYYFQAVSNSSWANEGYLVALDIIDEDGELLSELRRLNNAFGIGVIKLNKNQIEESEIILPARIKQELDWDTIDLLLRKNEDFKEFMDNVSLDIKNGKILNKANYDKVLNDEDFGKYIQEKKI